MSEPTADDLEVVEHNCPECGESFQTASGMATHRSIKHGVTGSSETTKRRRSGGDGSPKRPGRPRGGRRERREQAVRETLQELAQFSEEMQGRGTASAETLAEVIKRDAPKIAVSLSWVGEKLTPVGFLIDRTMGHGGVITIARGFNGVIMHAVRQWRELLHRRAEQAELDLLNEQLNVDPDAAPDAGAADQG